MSDSLINALGVVFSLWDFVKPVVNIAVFIALIFFGSWSIKHLVLDEITNKLDDAVRHLSAIEREVELMQYKLNNNSEIERNLQNSEGHLSDMVRRIESIEKQLQWFHKDTFASNLMKKLDSIESK